MRSWFRASLRSTIPGLATLSLTTVSLGLALTNESQAQQPPAWSPQPYAKPHSQEVPANSLRGDSAARNESAATPSNISNTSTTAVARWRKIDRGSESRNPSYSQTLANDSAPTTASNQPASGRGESIQNEQHSQQYAAPIAKRQAVTPSRRIVDSQQAEPIQLVSAQGRQYEDNAVQPASFAQVAPAQHRTNPNTGAAPRNTRNNASNDSSSRRAGGVQLANHQDSSLTPPSLELPPSLPPSPGYAPQPQTPNRSLPQYDEEPEMLPPSRNRGFDEPNYGTPNYQNNEPRGWDEDFEIPYQRSTNRSTIDCDTLRESLAQADITKIKIDTSPAFVEGYKTEDASNTKDAFVRRADQRSWYNHLGESIGQGQLVDMAYGSVVIESANGSRTTYLLNRLSDADQVYVSEAWGIPVSCSLNDGSFDSRDFIASTMTWKASGACHKPLYFEEVQLERYGHEWGPIVQPAISSVTFVKNVAFLPYKMGIHPMNECQYALGYYRPGSCAPWTVGPVPISLRGAAVQAAAIGGAAWALP